MNAPLRRLAIVVSMLFALLLTSTTYVQFIDASSLADGPGNSRTIYKEFGRERGPILVGGQPIAQSVKVKDSYGFQRQYPMGPEYAAVTGYYSIVYGSTGIESAESSYLTGTADQLFYRRIQDLLTGQEPQGASVSLTISARAQQAAWNALGNQRGAVVALDPRTGNILAMVSKPSFDPNQLASHNTSTVQAAWKQLLADPTRPLENRAISGRLYPPGSVFKLVTASAALSSGKYTPQTQVPGPAVLTLPQTATTLPNDFAGACTPSGQISLLDALRISCNTAFGGIGMSLGTQAMQNQAQAYGFGQKLSTPLPVTPSIFPPEPSQASLAQSAIGQFDVRVTPLQIAMVAAAIANHGVLMKPNLVATINGPNLEVISRVQPERLGQPISSDTANAMTTMMEAVVQNGTGTRAQIDGITVAGKTGTAQQGKGQPPNAWFTAFAPAADPQVVVAVVVDDGGRLGDAASGGRVAAPIARKVIQAVLQQ